MVINASAIGAIRTEHNDPRITKIGHYFRLLSLDELPQLINVISGDMSLVGPRPYLLKQKEEFDDAVWALRLQVKPGITGLAQASGRSNCSIEERTRLDLDYVKNRSFFNDMKILLSTVGVVLRQSGTN